MSEAYNESVRELLRDAARDLMQQTEAAKERHKMKEQSELEKQAGMPVKLIPLTRESAAVAWAVNGKPVFAMVNGVVRQITPPDNKPCPYHNDRWSCRVLEDETVRFYLNIGEDA